MAKKKKAADRVNVVEIMEAGKKMPKQTWWTNAKKAAKLAFKTEVKEDAKLSKDDPEELAEIKERTKLFSELYKSFDKGLGDKLKAVEAEKKLDKMLDKARDALVTVVSYQEKMKPVIGKIGTPAKAQVALTGALTQIKRGLELQIDILTDAL